MYTLFLAQLPCVARNITLRQFQKHSYHINYNRDRKITPLTPFTPFTPPNTHDTPNTPAVTQVKKRYHSHSCNSRSTVNR